MSKSLLMPVIASSEPAISITHLNHYYGQGSLRKQVLFDINLQINRGEILIMTGPSGSGKTTLLGSAVLVMLNQLLKCQVSKLLNLKLSKFLKP